MSDAPERARCARSVRTRAQAKSRAPWICARVLNFCLAPEGHSDDNADPSDKGGSGLVAFMLQKGLAFSERHSSEGAHGVSGGQLPRLDSLAGDGEWGGSPE